VTQVTAVRSKLAGDDMNILAMLASYRGQPVLADDVAYEVGLPSARSAYQQLRSLHSRGLVDKSRRRQPLTNWRISALGVDALEASTRAAA